MKITDALEISYKNGYLKGYKDAMAEVIRLLQEKQEAKQNHDETGIKDNH